MPERGFIKTRSKLAVGICFYQDVKGLKRLLDSLPSAYIDCVFAVDGKYPDYNAENPISNDGSNLEFFNRGYEHLVLTHVSADEPTKRNEYLRLCKVNDIDWLLIIDSDEYVEEANWDQFRKNLERPFEFHFYNIRMRYTESGAISGYPRLIHHPGELQYLEAHNIFQYPNGTITRAPTGSPLIEGITLETNDYLRSKEQIEALYQYQVKLMATEKKVKIKYGFSKRRDVPWETF